MSAWSFGNIVFAKLLRMRFLDSKLIVCISFLFLMVVAFWKLGSQPLYDWDEARHGQNALEMLRSGDLVNYSYNGKHDTWNAKPPLLIWSVLISYLAFGFNEFALRFPSALAGVVTVIVTSALAKLMVGRAAMWIAFAILVTSRGVFGFHTARTGDMDAFLVAFGMCSVFCWQLFLQRAESKFAFLASTFWGLAFYSKGLAALMFIPGAFALCFYNQSKPKWATILAAIGIALCFPVSWVIIMKKWGISSTTSLLQGASGTSLDVMLLYDVWLRLTGNIEGHGETLSFGFVFKQWDVYFSPWIFLFYIVAISAFFCTYRGSAAKPKIKLPPQFLKWSLFYLGPMILVLTFARSKLPWYIAPTIPFMSIVLAGMLSAVLPRTRWLAYLSVVVFVFAIVRQFRDYVYPREVDGLTFISENSDRIRSSACVKIMRPFTQSELLKLSWINPNVVVRDASDVQECPITIR